MKQSTESFAIPMVNIYSLAEYRPEDFLIKRFAEYVQEHKNLRLLHRHDFYHLVLFTKGAGSHAIDFESFPVLPFQIYFMIPGQVHSWDFTGKVEGYVINFSSTFFQPFCCVRIIWTPFLFSVESPERALFICPNLFRNR
ncbi:AraC family ligand binding domain-containing protein [Siphonobacter curvatus]|uniref:AraC family ligand binding domain-containing protein n=1 Tax=Siphonobacter curvatus TaxID=2094562 RepID=UPI001FAFD251|nr:AraC family ligand binding domain-containing protein [Siphonobacter curvatus]